LKLRTEQKSDRPNAMRADVVDKYIKSVLETGAQMAINDAAGKNWVKIIE